MDLVSIEMIRLAYLSADQVTVLSGFFFFKFIVSIGKIHYELEPTFYMCIQIKRAVYVLPLIIESLAHLK